MAIEKQVYATGRCWYDQSITLQKFSMMTMVCQTCIWFPELDAEIDSAARFKAGSMQIANMASVLF